jgi:hypothetical protein
MQCPGNQDRALSTGGFLRPSLNRIAQATPFSLPNPQTFPLLLISVQGHAMKVSALAQVMGEAFA